MISMLNVGLLGCGQIGRLVHLANLTRLSDVHVAAIAEPDPRLRGLAQSMAPKAAAYADYVELLNAADVEAVVICLPSALHAEAAVAAFERGKHVYLEKPLATSLAEGRRVLEAWQCAGMVGMIGFNYRFNSLYRSLRQHIRRERIGQVIGARSIFSTSPRELPGWKLTRQNGGGVLLDLGSHHMDLVPYLLGQDVREVFATLESRRSDADTATLQLRLTNGAVVQSFFFMNAIQEDRFEIYGETGKLAIDRYFSWDVEITDPILDFIRLKRFWNRMRSCLRSPYLLAKLRAPAYEPSYCAALVDFVDAVRANRPATPDFWDGYRSLEIIEAAEESARKGSIALLPNPRAEIAPALRGHDRCARYLGQVKP